MYNAIVEFCINNLSRGSYEAMLILEEDPNLDIVEYSCLSHCTLCEESIYALVNGEVVRGETPEELVKNVYKYLEENPF